MPSLSSTRNLDSQDPIGGLGPKKEPPPAPPPEPKVISPGIIERPNGKLETDFPLPPGEKPKWPFPTGIRGY